MSKKTFSNGDLQLKQQIIYYKSELAKYQKMISNYEDVIEKYKKQQILLKENIKNQGFIDIEAHEEIVRKYQDEIEKENESFQLLQEEYEKLKLDSEELQTTIQQLQKENETISTKLINLESEYHNLSIDNEQLSTKYRDLRTAYERHKKESEIKQKIQTIESQFSYSVMLPNFDQEEKDILVIGNFIIKNTGNVPLTKPVICIRINPVGYGRLSGKFGPKSTNFQDKLVDGVAGEEWAYIHKDWKEKVRKNGEYWLKPLYKEKIEPGELLTFSTFNLSLYQPIEKNSVIVEGYSYFNELPNGNASSNQIIVNY